MLLDFRKTLYSIQDDTCLWVSREMTPKQIVNALIESLTRAMQDIVGGDELVCSYVSPKSRRGGIQLGVAPVFFKMEFVLNAVDGVIKISHQGKERNIHYRDNVVAFIQEMLQNDKHLRERLRLKKRSIGSLTDPEGRLKWFAHSKADTEQAIKNLRGKKVFGVAQSDTYFVISFPGGRGKIFDAGPCTTKIYQAGDWSLCEGKTINDIIIGSETSLNGVYSDNITPPSLREVPIVIILGEEQFKLSCRPGPLTKSSDPIQVRVSYHLD